MASPCTGNTGQPGTKYSYAELQGLWIKAGGSRGTAPVAAAIALAESGGCSGDINPADNGGTQTSWGLWQISNGTHGQPAPNIMSPAVNAQQAVAKYNASGWSPWGTYNTGAYKAFLGSSTPDLNVPGASGTITGGQAAASIEPYSAGSCIVSFPGISVPLLGNVGQFCLLPKHTARALIGGGLAVAGVTLILPALGLIAIDVGLRAAGALGPAVQKAGGALTFVAPEAGAAVTAAGAAASSGRRTSGSRQPGRTAPPAGGQPQVAPPAGGNGPGGVPSPARQDEAVRAGRARRRPAQRGTEAGRRARARQPG